MGLYAARSPLNLFVVSQMTLEVKLPRICACVRRDST